MTRLLTGRVRLVDGLVIALSALLLFKAATFLLASSEPELGPDGLPTFARVLAHARTNYTAPDPATTGSVPTPPAPAPTKNADPQPAAPDSAEPVPSRPGPGERSASPSERALQERLAERREELAQRARELEARERLAEEVERRLDARSEEMRKGGPDTKPAEAATGPDDAEATALKGLVTMYETMKPKEAARVFERLPLDVLVPVVRRIAPRKMAEILAAMSPETAEKLTVALARRSRGGEDGRQAAAAPGLPAGELPAIEPATRPAARPR